MKKFAAKNTTIFLTALALTGCTIVRQTGPADAGDNGTARSGDYIDKRTTQTIRSGTIDVANPYLFPVLASVGTFQGWIQPGGWNYFTVPAGSYRVVLRDGYGRVLNTYKASTDGDEAEK